MSVSLTWAVVPVEPTVLGSASVWLKDLIVHAMNLGDPFEQTNPLVLRDEPRVLQWTDPEAVFLRGALSTMPAPWPDYMPAKPKAADHPQRELADELRAFLRELETRGALLIGAR